jgi:hypothetical protein
MGGERIIATKAKARSKSTMQGSLQLAAAPAFNTVSM